MSDALRALPPVDAVAAAVDAPRAVAVAAARAALAARRAELLAGEAGEPDVVARARALAAASERRSLRRVINATGVILHTNLGRAPLAAEARAAVAEVAEGYASLELDLATGARGSRHDHVEGVLRELTGAEAALVVNNGAGAALLAVAALAGPGREVVVSRGQLVEIGGGFRVPEVIAQAGARLVEVGTTNRTHLADYERAIGADTGAILRVHQSNFRQLGFVEDVPVAALCSLGPSVIDDAGSGALVDGLGDEPVVRASVAAGAALVAFSGDKLLGGPQAGLLVGRADAVARARAHPLARALRIDKLSLAALGATLRLYREPERARAEIPVLRMLADDGAARAQRLATAIGGSAEIVPAVARVGGGALPLLELPGCAVAVAGARAGVAGADVPRADGPAASPDALAARLRAGEPAVVARIEAGRLLLDPRTVADDEVEPLAAAVLAALG